MTGVQTCALPIFIVGGNFTAIGGVTRRYLARFEADGTLDAAFDPNANGAVFSVAIQADGSILAGGDFTGIGATSAGRIARLENSAATQTLSAPNSARVQWLRGATSPETVQVSFDLLPNGESAWIPLGAGVRSRLYGGWDLTGQSLPPSGQLRARARTIGGYSAGSSGVVETVAAFSLGSPDADGDGLLDTWELKWWGTTSGHSAGDDSDMDGLTELEELAFGLNPKVSDSSLRPQPFIEGGYLTVTVSKRPGANYEVQSAGTVLPGQVQSFDAATTTVLLDTPTMVKVRDDVAINTSRARFIRVKVTAAP